MESNDLHLVSRGTYIDHHPEHKSLNPLPPYMRQGLIAISVAACLSLLATSALFLYLSYKLIAWWLRGKSRARNAAKDFQAPQLTTDFVFEDGGAWASQAQTVKDLHERRVKQPRGCKNHRSPNQFLLLVYMLVLANMHAAIPFVMGLAWVSWNGIYINTATCWIEGYTQVNGDMASSIFITWIAAHTYMSVVKGYHLPQRALYFIMISTWVFVYVISAIPIIATMNGRSVGGYFVRVGPWCWISGAYLEIRLFTFNLWIFLSIIVVLALYVAIYLSPKRIPRSSSSSPDHASTASPTIDRNPAFLVYPVVYLVCNLPLAAGRLLRMADIMVPDIYTILTGVLVSLSGFIDVIVFGFTRKSIVFGSTEDVEDEDTGLSTFHFSRISRNYFGNEVLIEGGVGKNEQEEGWKGISGWWQSLRGGRQRLGSTPAPGNNDSQESLRREEAGDRAIHMDIITSVQVETNHSRENNAHFESLAYHPGRSTDGATPSLPSLKEWVS